LIWTILPIALLNLSSCEEAAKNSDKDEEKASAQTAPEEERHAIAQMQATSGSELSGVIRFTEKDGTVKMDAELKHVAPVGNHAIHIHAKGDCSAADGSSAGGHWNPEHEMHGTWGNKPYHKGDIGNFIVDSTGNGSIHFETDQWCVGCNDSTKNIVGKAIIVHKGEDDLTSQPSGAAGARIGCGVIQIKS
jgi:Cu-Zn family superoxide dismutase